jgi:hypothetical protein
MALIECKECGRKISNTASACPGCGHPRKVRGITRGGWKFLVVFGAIVVALTAFLYRIETTYSADRFPMDMRVRDSSPVCRDEDLYNNILNLIIRKDRLGAKRELNAAVANGQCQILEGGQQVTIQTSANFGLPCVRWSGVSQCWYISPTLMELIP